MTSQNEEPVYLYAPENRNPILIGPDPLTRDVISLTVNVVLNKSRLHKLVILEGGDKVGKSTLYQAFRRATNYGPLVIDRFTGSNWVYDQFYHRESDSNSLFNLEETLNKIFDIHCFILRTSPEIQKARINRFETTEVDRIKALENFEAIDQLFQDYSKVCRYKNIHTFYTDRQGVQETVELMKELCGLAEKG